MLRFCYLTDGNGMRIAAAYLHCAHPLEMITLFSDLCISSGVVGDQTPMPLQIESAAVPAGVIGIPAIGRLLSEAELAVLGAEAEARLATLDAMGGSDATNVSDQTPQAQRTSHTLSSSGGVGRRGPKRERVN